jgi:CubicO group peptidase (beta-lactamase class C family)
MKQLMDGLTAWRIPGNTAAIFKDGKLVFKYSSGVKDIETGEKMQGDELLYLYSCTKVATTLAALQLLEKGKFLLDEPVAEFIPEFKDMTVKTQSGVEKCSVPITMRHLFTMTSGFNYLCNGPAFDGARELTAGKFDTLTTIKCIAKQPLDFVPGEKWQYSLCHDVLAAVVEVISGEKFRDYVSKHIFEPCGVKEAYFHDDKIKDRIATQHRFYAKGDSNDIVKLQKSGSESIGGKNVKVEKSNYLIFGEEYDSGGAGIIASIKEYGKVFAAVANNGITQNGEQIISRSTIDLWRENQLNEAQLKTFNWSWYKGYGYGLGVRTMINRAISGSTSSFGEFGWGGAAGAQVIIDVENNIALAYAHHMLNPQEGYVYPRLRNVLYTCMNS